MREIAPYGLSAVAPARRTALFRLTLPRRLIRLRHLHGLSQQCLARQAGLAASTVNEIESGLCRDIKLTTLLHLCARFEVSPDFLLGFDVDEQQADHLVRAKRRPEFLRVRANTHPYKCGACDHLLTPAHLHTQGECILTLHERGRSTTYIASFYGLGPASVEHILREEYAALRRRSGAAPPPAA